MVLAAATRRRCRRSSASGWRTHWNRERITLVALGIICFYVIYVSYRNLKSFLPFVIETKYDRELHLLDRALFFGHEPATVLHTCSAPASRRTCCPTSTCGSCRWCRWCVTAWLVWSRNLSYGYWFVTSQCLAWTLGTLSYYALPTLGPGLRVRPSSTPTSPTPRPPQLMDSLDSRPGRTS